MTEPKPAKVAVVDEVKKLFKEADATIVTEYRGLTVTELAELRTDLAKSSTEYKVYKNTLVRIALSKESEEFTSLLEGPTAIAFVKGDAVTAAKTLADFAKGNDLLVLKGGLLGDTFLDADQAKQLAKIPPRDVLLAQLAGGMAAPMQQFAGLLGACQRNFANGLKALIDKGGAAA
jgi:large subunit ribosomal protein L10